MARSSDTNFCWEALLDADELQQDAARGTYTFVSSWCEVQGFS